MTVEITGSGPKLTDDHLAAFDHRAGRTIPAPYRELLLRHHGGYPNPSVVVTVSVGSTVTVWVLGVVATPDLWTCCNDQESSNP